MPMTPDEERWAEALIIERMHGEDADDYIAERIAFLSGTGDEAGAQRFQEIAAKLAQLRAGSVN
jgi:hypothetical protein